MRRPRRTFVSVSLKLTPEEMASLDALQRDLGAHSRSDVIRMALRLLARQHGLLVDDGMRAPRSPQAYPDPGAYPYDP